MRMLVEERLRGDQEPWRAITALRGAEVSERLLKWVQPVVGREAFDGHDIASAAVDAEHQARQHRLAIEEHRARAALSEFAAVLGACEIQILAQDLEQRLVRIERDLGRLAVDGERYLRLHAVRRSSFGVRRTARPDTA